MKICLVSSFGKQSGIATYSKTLQSYLNCGLYPWDFFDKISMTISPLSSLFKLRKLAKQNDVIHVQYHLGEQGPLFLPMLWLLPGKWVITLHEDHKNFHLPWFWIWWHNLWLRRANGIIVHTQVHKNIIGKHLHKKTFVIPFGVSKKKADLPTTKYSILVPGFINRWKGHDIAIKAMPEVLKCFPEAELHIIGKVWDKKFLAELNQSVKDLKLESCVFINHEFVSGSQYDEYMKRSHIVVLPYRKITMSAVLADAIGYGKGVVLSDIAPFTEYGKSCLLYFAIGPKEHNNLAKAAIRSFRGDFEFCVGDLAEEYAWPNIVKKHLEVYNFIVTQQ